MALIFTDFPTGVCVLLKPVNIRAILRYTGTIPM